MTDNELLQKALEQGIIDLESVQKLMGKKEQERLLSKHTYKISYSEKDNRWKTTIPDSSKKSGRRLIAKTNKEDLEKILIEYYRNLEESHTDIETKEVKPKKKDRKERITQKEDSVPTIREIFPEWLKYKNIHITASSYLSRIKVDWNKYYENDEIVDIPLDQLDYLSLDTWVCSIIKQYSMTKTKYYNMSVIIRQIFEYAVEKGYLKENTFQRVKVNSKMFTKRAKPKNDTQVFNEEDERAICELAEKKYYGNPTTIYELAIAFNFQLGLRVGELVALRWDDIKDNYIHIQRMETTQYCLQGENIIFQGPAVVDHTKSPAGDRILYLTREARRLLKLVKERSEKYGYQDGDYIFVSSYNRRIHARRVIRILYNLCDEVNCDRKSSHKIRKTYISSLFDTGMNINKIREIAGHEDERTSLHNYCFDRRSEEDVEKMLEANSVHRK